MRTSIVATSRAALAAIAIIAALLAGVAGSLLTKAVHQHDEMAFILDLQRRLSAFSVAGDMLLTTPADPATMTTVIAEGRSVKQALQRLGPDNPDVRNATRAIDIILQMLATTAPEEGEAAPLERLREIDPTVQSLISAISTYGMVLDRAAGDAVESHSRAIGQETRFLFTLMAVLSALFAITSFVGFLLLYRRVGLPLQAVAETIRKIDAGDRDARMPETRTDELGEVARAFNSLVGRHEASQRDLARSSALVRMASEVAQFGGWRYVVGAPKLEWTEGTALIHDLEPGFAPTVEEGIRFYHEDDRARIEADFRTCLKTGEPFDGVYRLKTAKGREIIVRSVCEAELDASGETVAVHGAFQDITTLRALDQQLFEAQKLDTIGQLTGGIAHDFNNLLTIILGNADLLVEALPDKRTQRLASAVLDAAERGAELTDSLLAYSRRQPLRPELTKVNTLIERSAMLFRQGVPGDVEMEYHLGAKNALCKVDPGRLQSSLLNLVLNASQAISGRGRILVETELVEIDEEWARSQPDTRPGNYVCISVSDNGHGMTSQTAARAFEPFFTTKPQGEGSGLGLSSVYGFLQQSGGHARIYSELGSGTIVRLYVPLAEAGAEEKVEKAAAEETVHPDGQGEHVLVVEDDEALRRNVEEQLARLNYRVSSAANAEEALTALAAEPDVDLLFTDVVMPGLINGADLAREARSHSPDLKVLFTSGYTQQSLIHDGRLEDGTLLLTKPYRSTDLARVLRIALAGGELNP